MLVSRMERYSLLWESRLGGCGPLCASQKLSCEAWCPIPPRDMNVALTGCAKPIAACVFVVNVRVPIRPAASPSKKKLRSDGYREIIYARMIQDDIMALEFRLLATYSQAGKVCGSLLHAKSPVFCVLTIKYPMNEETHNEKH